MVAGERSSRHNLDILAQLFTSMTDIVIVRVLTGKLFYLNILPLTKNVRLEIFEVLEHTHSCCHVTPSTRTLWLGKIFSMDQHSTIFSLVTTQIFSLRYKDVICTTVGSRLRPEIRGPMFRCESRSCRNLRSRDGTKYFLHSNLNYFLAAADLIEAMKSH